jgi:hypothetical protein
MNRTKTILAAAVVAVSTIAFVLVRSPKQPSEPTSPLSTAQGIAPNQSDPATTSERVPQSREDGIVPLPTDAVGVSKPKETKKN